MRERLEQDLYSTKAALRQRANHTGRADTAVSDSQDRIPSSEVGGMESVGSCMQCVLRWITYVTMLEHCYHTISKSA